MSSDVLDQAVVVVAHDYVTQRGGAERVALSLLEAFPGSTLVTSVYCPEDTFEAFRDHDVRTLWPDRVPMFRKDARRAMPVLAQAFGRAAPPRADLVFCSSSGWSHGLRSTAPKIVYCHTPARWLYETEDYLPEVPRAVRPFVRASLPMLRQWDAAAARGVDLYLANSSTVQRRIADAYGRQAPVVFPPVTLDPTGPRDRVAGFEPGFLLVVSRKRGYKHVAQICEAVEALPDQRLVVVGGLPEREGGREWSARISGATRLTDAELRWLYAEAQALIAVSHEDFGLTPVEAYAFGTPAVLLRAGGYLDSSVSGVTCVFIEDTEPPTIVAGISECVRADFSADRIKEHARSFGEARFHRQVRDAARSVLEKRRGHAA